jgi:hypothetical protein
MNNIEISKTNKNIKKNIQKWILHFKNTKWLKLLNPYVKRQHNQTNKN